MPIEVESPEQLGYESIKCNLAESSVSDVMLGEFSLNLDDLVLAYGHHVGKPELRALIARDASVSADDVLLAAGAAGALFIANTTLLEKGDHMIVMHPNYSTNIEIPRLIGCNVDMMELSLADGFQLDIEELKRRIRPETKLISLTTPHNPTGTMISEATLREVVRIAEERGIYVLVDETYRDIAFGEQTPLAASLSSRCISVASVSKAYGIPGIRIGWIISRDTQLMERFLAAKEAIYISNSVIDEEIAYLALREKTERLAKVRAHVEANFSVLKEWLAGQEYLDYVLPAGGVVCFPKIKDNKNIDVDLFYNILNDTYKTHVGPGHWFGMDRRYMRIGFGWPSKEELREGLQNITRALKDAEK